MKILRLISALQDGAVKLRQFFISFIFLFYKMMQEIRDRFLPNKMTEMNLFPTRWSRKSKMNFFPSRWLNPRWISSLQDDEIWDGFLPFKIMRSEMDFFLPFKMMKSEMDFFPSRWWYLRWISFLQDDEIRYGFLSSLQDDKIWYGFLPFKTIRSEMDIFLLFKIIKFESDLFSSRWLCLRWIFSSFQGNVIWDGFLSPLQDD